MLGLFGLFGRSSELRRIDQELRAAGLHPCRVSEAVKLTARKLLQEEGGDAALAAGLLAYCMLGEEQFAQAHDHEAARLMDQRVQAAIEAGDSLDARLIMLCLQARAIHPDLVERHGLEIG